MPHGSSPPFTDRLFWLAGIQLQMQTSRSGTLDTSAIGVMALDAALATIVLTTRATALWIVALVLFGLSFSLAAGALSLPSAEETGPFVPDMLKARTTQDDRQFDASFLIDIAADLRTNKRALTRKVLLFNTALTLLMLAVTTDLAGRL